MNIRDCFKEICRVKRTTLSELGESMGCTTRYLTNAFGRKGVTLETVLKAADAADYEVVLQPKRRSGRRTPDQFVIGGNEE